MIKTVEVSSLEELMPILTDQEYRTDIDRYRTEYIYRGIPDSSFRMTTSLYRNCKHLQKKLEPAILRNFTKYAALSDPAIEKSVWRQMILGQHYGLPTRLLDWTHSPLIGLHFAVTEDDMDMMSERDCVLWRVDMTELHQLLPDKYRAVLAKDDTVIFSMDKLEQVASSLAEYDEDMQDKAMVVIEPPSVDPRIINQYSFFSAVPSGMSDVEVFLDRMTEKTIRYVIHKEIRWKLRDMLDQINISERIVYPGLDGLSKWLGRHYFVKN